MDPELLAMQVRFYFNLFTERERIVDRVGMKLSRDEVMSPAIMDKVRERWPGTADLHEWQGWWVEIVDTTGYVVRTLPLI